MEYKGYKIQDHQSSGGGKLIRVYDVRDFNPVHIFECGQCFRWYREHDGSYTGVAKGKVANIFYDAYDYCSEHNDGHGSDKGGTLYIRNADMEDFKNVWYDYLDLGRNYGDIKEALMRKDDIMKKAVEFGYGIRLLRQDFWETLISFIISANNRIPMIMKVVASISESFGKKILINEKAYHTFPDVENLASASIEQLAVCRAGFRCKYIDITSKMVEEGCLKPSELYLVNTDEAREMLKQLPGVGDKVADCTLLYSGIKYDVFPTDVWVKRVMEELYFHREATLKEIQKFAANYFGELAGFAQQYLFYYARENKIGAK
ncbi:MAG TPA: DNA glycosylase [Clostridiales bacterium]|nr:DNA glycosylase [Clostridiales bacterium]